MRIATLVLVVLVVLLARHVQAEPTWTTTRGTRTTGRAPGSFILYTDAAPGWFSEGAVISKEPVALPLRLDVTWRRLGPEAGRSMHVTLAGGVLLLRTGKISFWPYDDAAFAGIGWKPVPALRAHDEQTIVVTQDQHEIVVALDGREVARFPFSTMMTSAPVGIGMKGGSGYRSAIRVRALAVH